YRIVQEALTNAVRHAGGTRVRVGVAVDGAVLRIDVMDDGPCADEEPEPAAPGGRWRPWRASAPRPAARAGASPAGYGAGYGLVGMRERVRSVGGTLSAGPRPEGGFAVAAVLPLTGGPQ
ncbi:sensor histidine kinase, partial [Streptacidiphilus griseoplanus]|uniref:sensor histidine kinase n=1 Tax=Peterkaempfera griseoplana TaxID=66896 RepID=UPI000A47564E